MQPRDRTGWTGAPGLAELQRRGGGTLRHRLPDGDPASERGAPDRGALVRPRFSIALLSEDRSKHTWRGLMAIVEKLLRRFEEDGFTRRTEIVPADPNVRPVLIANRWRNTTG